MCYITVAFFFSSSSFHVKKKAETCDSTITFMGNGTRDRPAFWLFGIVKGSTSIINITNITIYHGYANWK